MQDLENTATKIPETHDPEKSTNQRVGEHLFEQLWHTNTKKKSYRINGFYRTKWMGVVEQQLGEKPPCTSTCTWEENPGLAVPHIPWPLGLGQIDI